MRCSFGLCHTAPRSSSFCCCSISNRRTSSGFRFHHRSSSITKVAPKTSRKMGAFGNVDSISLAATNRSALPARRSQPMYFPLLGVTPIKGRFLNRLNVRLGATMSSSLASGSGRENLTATRKFSAQTATRRQRLHRGRDHAGRDSIFRCSFLILAPAANSVAAPTSGSRSPLRTKS